MDCLSEELWEQDIGLEHIYFQEMKDRDQECQSALFLGASKGPAGELFSKVISIRLLTLYSRRRPDSPFNCNAQMHL